MPKDGYSRNEAAVGAEPCRKETLGDPSSGYDGTLEVRRVQKLCFTEFTGAYAGDPYAEGRYRWQPGWRRLLGRARFEPDRELLSEGCVYRCAGFSSAARRNAHPAG